MSATCTYHCAACDACFTSLEAFDLHRQQVRSATRLKGGGDHAERRCCVPPDDVDRLAVQTSEGVCRLAKGPERVGVVLYCSKRHDQDRQGAIERLRQSERAAAHPSGVVADRKAA